MTAAARKPASSPVLRTAAGEPPLGHDGESFRADQGEMFEPDNASYRSLASRIGVLELENGKWLSFPFGTDREQFDSRDAALRSGIAAMVRKARRYMRNGEGAGTHWTEGYAGRVIEWALSLKPAKDLNQGTSDVAAPASGHPGTAQVTETLNLLANPDQPISVDAGDQAGVTDDRGGTLAGEVNQPVLEIPREASGTAREAPSTGCGTSSDVGIQSAPPTSSDPIVRSLVEAHRARKAYPAGHIFSMTNPVINGHMVTLGTCSCGDTFSYAWGSYERMDAAIEAHWQKFDHLPEKVDGRGEPIGASAPVAKKPRKKKSGEAAPIGASTDEYLAGIMARTEPSEPPRLEAFSNAEDDPVREAGFPGGSLALADDDDEFRDSPLIRAAIDLAWRDPPMVSDLQAKLLDFGKVYASPKEVTRPVLRWHGGKWKLAPWVISHFPPHKVYVEPFGGAGSVLLQKLPAITEVWNDLEGEVVNLFRVLRSRADDLARLIYLTPFSREEYHSLYEQCDDPVERARRFVARSFLGQSSKGALRKSGFDSRINPDGFVSRLNSLRAMPEEFHAIAERFRGVIIEQRPADAIFAQYDRQDVLFYVDPPYLSDRANHYTHELDEAGHIALLEILRSIAGMVVLSGYRSELYDAALTDWRRVEIDAHADGGVDRTEIIWLNPACAAALDVQHPTLFNIAALDVVNTPPPATR